MTDKADLDTDLKHVREQGKMAREMHDDESNNFQLLPHDNPYGPGEKHDAWREGAGFPVDEIKQVDTSDPTTADVRIEPEKTVRKPAKGRSGGKGKGKGKGGAKAGDRTATTTTTTGNAETSLPTKTGTADPTKASEPNVETKLGDPRGTEGDRTTVDADKLM